MKTLIVYFSHDKENYVNGNIQYLEVGNTKVVAEMLQPITNGDLFEIKPIKDYPENYDACTKQAREELDQHIFPKIKTLPDIDDYDIIYLGYPNWWSTMPMCVFTFLESCDLKDKVIYPFCTHEGSGMGRSEADIKKLCPSSHIKKGLAIRGSQVHQVDGILKQWVEKGGNNNGKEVMMVTGAGQISMAIARRMGYGKKIIMGDKNLENAKNIAKIMNDAGFDVEPFEMDLSSRASILEMIQFAQSFGEISMLVNGAGVSPSQAPIEAILKVDLYGTAVLLEEVGKVIKEGGVGVTISSQSGHRMEQLGAKKDELLATTPTEKLLELDFLQKENIKDTLHAYQLAKRCNEKRVMSESVKWGERGARINSISPGNIVTPLAIDEFNGPRGDFYKNMFAKCSAGRPGTADEVANVAELLMSDKGAFITGADFLIDGGATASYFYGPLKPQE